MSRDNQPVLMGGGSDFDALSRSEAVVTRRIGGGRQQVWSRGTWLPYTPPPKPVPAPAPAPVAALAPGEQTCKKGRHVNPDWYVNPSNGWRSCRDCRKSSRHK